MIANFHNVLVLAPHTDDGELGAGGTIAKLLENGAIITYVAFSTAEQSVPDELPKDILKTEVRAATCELGIDPTHLIILNYEVRKLNYFRQEILEDLIRIRSETKYDLVIMPSLNDLHQDHKTIAEEGLRAFKETTILGYELIWNNLTFNTTSFVRLEHRHIDIKCRALQKYESQNHRAYMSPDFVFSLAKSRGIQIGANLAESFEVVRWVM